MPERKDPLDTCVGFDWDEANAQKNWQRHRVTPEEAEDVFFNEPLVVRSDVRHSKEEKRYYALGQTSDGRYLFVAFTVRASLVRVISVRDMNRRERGTYANHEKENGA
uniref:BrnT family toxin n=1 Tax=Solibacter usitatus (strain Ellin6076) TaxID=234267 RepID=Q01SA5_SOLUE